MVAARQAVMDFIKPHCSNELEEIDILVALQEALANAVFHGCEDDPSKTIYCSVEIDASGFTITIRDPGPRFDVEAARSPTEAGANTTPHGRGICLMRSLMNEVTYRHGGAEVHLRRLRGCAVQHCLARFRRNFAFLSHTTPLDLCRSPAFNDIVCPPTQKLLEEDFLDTNQTRRLFLGQAGASFGLLCLGSLTPDLLAKAHAYAQSAHADGAKPYRFFTPQQAAEFDAFSAQIIPTDDTPGAREANVVHFTDYLLSTIDSDQQAP